MGHPPKRERVVTAKCMSEDCGEVLKLLANYELSLECERRYRESHEIEEAERVDMIHQCKTIQHDSLRDIEKHKRTCIVYNPNVFKEP